MAKIVFRDWLLEQGVDVDKFIENCRPENRNWEHTPLEVSIFNATPDDYIVLAFKWESSSLRLNFSELEANWRIAISGIPEENIELGFSESIDISKGINYEPIRKT